MNKITNHQYKTLRNKSEFKALIKAGRALNSVAFAMRLLDESKNGNSQLEQRQQRKSITMLAGFCHEGCLLANKLNTEFSGKTYISGFANMLGSGFDKERQLLSTIRNKISFHLDHEDRTVKDVLQEIDSLGANDSDEEEFYGSSTGTVGDFSFPFGDILDFNFIIMKSAQVFGLSDQRDAEEKFITSISTFSNELVKALDEFINGLMTELSI